MPSIYTLDHGDADKEQQRLDFQHDIFKAVTRDDLPRVIWQHLNSLSAPKIADANTGTGIFLKDLAPRVVKEAQLDGFDIDTRKFHDPVSLPANVKLQYGNVLEPFPKEYLALKKDEWLQAVKNLKTLLKPNGYLFWSEIGAYGYASNPYSAALHEWKRIESTAAVKFGRDPKCPVLLPTQFQAAGLEQVDEKVFVTLGRPDLTPTITRVALEYMAQSLHGIQLLDQDETLGLTESGIKSLVETLTEETEDGIEVGTNLHWVWGQNSGNE
ncbi:methyltransferase domain protein [Fusarium subglutinans]|uniref:Methyltransferase domain protein n=1 Tax=Gibberella subglutinans TaxID=42677 RepID=A0A8H5QB03_GIBSU|nr:methyltransferase domain protein [Fusarium subglutinans]KAF5611967.1 methyltransferase domain protein [Fusarium subglutinans]